MLRYLHFSKENKSYTCHPSFGEEGGRGEGVRFHLGALPERALENNELFCCLYFYISKKNNEIFCFFVFL